MEIMSALASSDYATLLVETLPAVPQNERENERLLEIVEQLAFKKKHSIAEKKLVELLVVLIEQFEEEHYPIKDATPLEVLIGLMESHALKQKDLVTEGIFETPSVASEVLNGKRDLTKEHIKRLSKRFHVSPEVFF